jgi:hypothetical protein
MSLISPALHVIKWGKKYTCLIIIIDLVKIRKKRGVKKLISRSPRLIAGRLIIKKHPYGSYSTPRIFDKESLLDTMFTLKTKADINNKDYRLWYKLNEDKGSA